MTGDPNVDILPGLLVTVLELTDADGISVQTHKHRAYIWPILVDSKPEMVVYFLIP